MRRALRTGLLLAVVSALAALVATAALAASRTQVAFTVQMSGFGGALITSTIPNCATATVGTPEAGWFFHGQVGHFYGQHSFDCGDGNTFTVSYIAHSAGGSVTNTGTWKVIGGTGMFARLAGNGTLSANGTPGADTFLDIYTGTMLLP